MTILTSSGCDVYDYPCAHDKDESKYYYFKHKPANWKADTIYIKSTDIVIPPIATGFMWECKSSGKSDTLNEPLAPTVENSLFDDNTVQWKTKPYNALLQPGDIIGSSDWTVDDAAILIDDFGLESNYLTSFRLYGVPVDATEVVITNVIVVTLASNKEFTYNRSLRIPIKEL